MKRILVVEDDHSSEKVLRHIVRSVDENALVEWVDNAEKATLLLAQENSAGRRYDLILSDIYLAGNSTGLDMWGLREEFFPFTPVVLTSSISRNKLLSIIGLETRPPPFLQKPVPLAEWESVLRTYL